MSWLILVLEITQLYSLLCLTHNGTGIGKNPVKKKYNLHSLSNWNIRMFIPTSEMSPNKNHSLFTLQYKQVSLVLISLIITLYISKNFDSFFLNIILAFLYFDWFLNAHLNERFICSLNYSTPVKTMLMSAL